MSESRPAGETTAAPLSSLPLAYRQHADAAGDLPDVHGFLDAFPDLCTADVLEVLRADQDLRWRRGCPVPAEQYLARQPRVRGDAEAALRLVYGEVLLRLELGESPTAEEYTSRFPELGDGLARQLRLELGLIADAPGRTFTTDAGSPPLPPRVGRYRVIERLGEGGQAVVYRASHPELPLDLAVKWGKHPLSDNPAAAARFRDEGRILVRLDHPHLARVYDLGVWEGRPYLAFEYIPGRSLEQVARQQRLGDGRIAELVAGCARALAAAHRQGVTHLDLKPANILIDAAGRPRVIDFGLAQTQHAWSAPTAGGQLAGTPSYMAPEQVGRHGDRLGPHTDVFALGGVLYFLLTGRPPYQAASLNELLDQASRCAWDRDALRRCGRSAGLVAVCERALAAEPGRRFADADALAEHLERLGRPRWGRRATLAVLLAALAAAAWLAWRPTAPPEPAPGLLPQPELHLRVWRDGRYRRLPGGLPVRQGDELAVAGTLPAGVRAVLVLRTAGGQVRELARWPAQVEATAIRYPPEQDRAVPLQGAAGTVLVLLCGRRAGPIDLRELSGALQSEEAWPALPRDSLLRLVWDGTAVEQAGRDFGPVRRRDDPEGEVLARLEGVRRRLRAAGHDVLAGLAVGVGD